MNGTNIVWSHALNLQSNQIVGSEIVHPCRLHSVDVRLCADGTLRRLCILDRRRLRRRRGSNWPRRLRLWNRTLKQTLNRSGAGKRHWLWIGDSEQSISSKHCSSKEKNASDEANLTRSIAGRVQPQQMHDTLRKGAAIRRHR